MAYICSSNEKEREDSVCQLGADHFIAAFTQLSCGNWRVASKPVSTYDDDLLE